MRSMRYGEAEAPHSKGGTTKPYVFNHDVGVDVLEVKDAAGTFFDILNCVDYGTTFEHAFRRAFSVGPSCLPAIAACTTAESL